MPERERDYFVLAVASAATGYFCCCRYRHHRWRERIIAAAADHQSKSPITCQKQKSSQVNDNSSKKRKSGDVQSFFAGNRDKDAVYFEFMSKKYVGKWILLMAADTYPRGGVPPDVTTMLFQYYVVSVNRDFKTAGIAYDNSCIMEGDNQFMNYPNTTGAESRIENYNLETFEEDEKRYNVNLGCTNKIKNDIKDATARQAKENLVAA